MAVASAPGASAARGNKVKTREGVIGALSLLYVLRRIAWLALPHCEEVRKHGLFRGDGGPG